MTSRRSNRFPTLQRRGLVALLGISTLSWINPVLADTPGIAVTQRDGTVTIASCVADATKALRKLKFTNITTSETHAEGDFQDYSALITCYQVESAPAVTVQSIIIAGPASDRAGQLRDSLIKAMP